MKLSQSARIIGLGSYLPKKILTNQDLEKLVETSDEWIVSRTGMKERRIADAKEFSSDMGAFAGKIALEKAQITPQQVDLILVATMSPDYLAPSTAALIQAHLKAENAAAMDIGAACSGFLYALSMAKAYIESGMYRTILLVAAEKMSALVDYKDRNTCVLFGDGAAAAVITREGPGLAINSICLGADGCTSDLLVAPGGARLNQLEDPEERKLNFLRMNGKELFRHAVRRMTHASNECLTQAGLQKEQISWIVPHQANIRIIEALAKAFSLPIEKVYMILHKYGNTSASSVAIALDELTQEHPLKVGEHLLLVAFGAGLTWGSSILTKIDK